jgi:CubicO group peptidase (beta-lactamase class C family)
MLTTVEYQLPRTAPEQQGIASAAVLQWVEAIEQQINELHSFMLLRHGNVIAEGWWSPYGRDIPHMIFSLSKSFTSTAVGLAVSEGLFTVDDSVLSFFPDETPTEVSDLLAAMQVRHLLSMSTGHAEDTWMPMVLHEEQNWLKAFFEVPVRHEPGTHFLYNTGATHILAAIVEKKTGMKLVDYLQPRLFEPLGITNPRWEESPQGIALGGTGLNITTEDIAKFGQLYLQKGMWQGKQLLPEAWIAEATTAHIANGTDIDSDWNQGYGYQFWRCRHNAYRGDGAFGQYCIVMPEQDVVLAITGGVDDMQEPLNLVWNILLPAMQTESLPEDTAAHTTLSAKLSSLSRLPVQGQATSTIAAQVSNRTYRVDANDLNVETITLNFNDSGCMVSVKQIGANEEIIQSGYEQWQSGETLLFNEPWESQPARIVTSGAWTAADTYTMVVRFYETPFKQLMICHFVGNELLIETRINLSFETIKTQILTARAV